MMNDKQKTQVSSRLKRIEGQIRGIEKMVAEDRYCMDILAQTRSVMAALRAVEDKIMEQHMQTCMVSALASGSDQERQDKTDEIMSLLTQYRKHG